MRQSKKNLGCYGGRNGVINIIVVYRRPGKIEKNGTWKGIPRNINKNEGIIILGDFNAHHTMWNCEEIGTNGYRLLEELEDEDMFIVNHDTKTRIGGIGQKDSNLDLIFCNSRIHHMISYYQGDDSWGSDHYPVFFKCEVEYKLYEKKSNRITSNRTDWKKYVGLFKDRKNTNWIVINSLA